MVPPLAHQLLVPPPPLPICGSSNMRALYLIISKRANAMNKTRTPPAPSVEWTLKYEGSLSNSEHLRAKFYQLKDVISCKHHNVCLLWENFVSPKFLSYTLFSDLFATQAIHAWGLPKPQLPLTASTITQAGPCEAYSQSILRQVIIFINTNPLKRLYSNLNPL